MWRPLRLSSRCFFSSWALFLSTFLICNYYWQNSNFDDQLANETISIEQALRRIATCTSTDRSRQRALLHTLQAWSSLARHNHIQYWIAYGTLVGYVHRGALLPYDSNIDIFIMAHDTSQLLELSRLNLSSNYKVQVHPQWYLVEQTKRSYYYSEGIDFLAPNARFFHLNDTSYLNIWPVYDYNPNETRIEKSSKAMLTTYDKDYKWKSSSKEWTFPLEECQFSGIKVWCPAEPDKLVNDIYGQVTVNVSSTTCVNGSWIKPNEYRSTKTTVKMTDESTTSTTKPFTTTTMEITSESTTSTTKPFKTTTVKITSKSTTSTTKPSTTTIMETTSESTTSTTKPSTTTSTTSTQPNDSDLIERVLEKIPVCTAGDRRHQRILLTNLQAWAQLAGKHNIQYWLSYGSLVGYVQRRGLLPHDGDVDVNMMTDDIPQLIKISQTNFSSTFAFQIQPDWNIVNYKKRSYAYDQGIDFQTPNARFVDRETNNHVDIFPAYNFNPDSSRNFTEKTPSENITEYDLWYRWLSHPRTWIYPLQTCYFSEIKVLCPAEPEKLVVAIYGEKSLTKSDRKCVNGSWVSTN